MENNPSVTPNQLNASSTSKYKPEVPYMIQEGRLEHLEEIANEIELYEKWEPKWDIQKNVLSICGTLLLTGIGLLLGESNLQYKFLICVVTVASFIGLISCGINIFLHYVENKHKHAFLSKKIKNIIQKVKDSRIEHDLHNLAD